MNPDVVDAALALTAVAAWFGGYALARFLTRPASPRPGPATQDLGPEPPAVVSLLANRWQMTEDAAESTLLDLAARKHVELRQPGADPMQTTVHVRAEAGAGLKPYEARVLDRVAGLAVGGVVPVTALTFRNDSQATSWNKRLRAEVVADARALGLSQRRFGPTAVALLTGGAAAAALVLALAAGRHALRTPDSDGGLAFYVLIFGFVVLAGIGARYPGERDTPAGREVAARWLGVRDWLRGHEEFANLPPAATTVWDRYLAYGAAVGVTRVASRVLDLGMGDRRRVWSCFGGTWHRVRVRYPRFWPRYGQTARNLAWRSGSTLAFGVVLLLFRTRPRAWAAQLDPSLASAPVFDLFETLAYLAGIVFIGYGSYKLARTLLDLATQKTVTGEVLWLDVWRSTSRGEDSPPEPWLYYLAVDDGSADRTTAWGLPAGHAGSCHDGDTVRITVRRWSRRVVEFTVVERGRSRALVESVSTVDTENLITGEASPAAASPLEGVVRALSGPDVAAGSLLTAEEVSQALGLAVRPDAAPVPGPFAMASFTTVEKRKSVLLVQVGKGTMADWAWRRNLRGTTPLAIADGAFAKGDRGGLRVGDLVVIVTLLGPARGRTAGLPWLLALIASRVGAETPA